MKQTFLRMAFLCLLLSLIGCNLEKDKVMDDYKQLSVQHAKFIYESATNQMSTKATDSREKTNMFFRKEYSLNWKAALPTSTDDVSSVDIPTDEERRYLISSLDGQGYYLTRCHHSITIVRSLKTGATGVYHHFFIPFRDSRDKYRDSFDGELYRNFHNNGFRDDFSGLEVYSDLDGRIVKLLRYYRGKQYASFFARDGLNGRISHNLCYYIHKAYGIRYDVRTKDGGHFICPQCGSDLYESESGYYYCTHCDWNELDFYEQEIEETIIYGEGGGGGWSSGGNDDPNPDLPDPNTGNGGGNSGAGNSNPPGDPGDGIPENIHIDPQISFVNACLTEIMDDCGVSQLLSSLSETTIHIVPGNSLYPIYVDPTPLVDGSYNVVCSTVYLQHHTLVEELFHCLQVVNGYYNSNWALNVEVEAKYAAFLFADRNGEFDDLPGNTNQKQALLDYRALHSEENYLQIENYIKTVMPAYANFGEDPTKRSMPNLGTMFDCNN